MSSLVRDKIRLIMEQMLQEEEKRVAMDIPIPGDIWELKTHFDKAGKQLFLVGGAVRDFLSGTQIKDYDLATDATPEEIIDLLPKQYNILEAGNIFPVIHLVTPEKGRYEIATFREDISSSEAGGHRKPETRFATIGQDVQRRDFTINALFYDLNTKEVVDLVGGLDDLQNGRVKAVGDAYQRFEENQIRKLRAIRFAARLGSDLDPGIKEALLKSSSMSTEAPEAIQTEFLKGIKQAQNVVYYISMLFDYGLDKWVFRDLNAKKRYAVDTKVADILFASLVREEKRGLRKYIKMNLKYNDHFAKRVEFFVAMQHLSPDNVMELYKKNTDSAKISPNDLRKAGDIMGYDKALLSAFIKFEPVADSQELMDQGYKGKELGQMMNKVNVDHFMSLL